MKYFWEKWKKELKPDWLIVGLGNPGIEYAETRHNIGWMIADALAEKYNTKFKVKSINYEHCLFEFNQNKILCIKPLTFMNNSGKAVLETLEKYKINISNCIIILDEYNFPLGKIHIKSTGSHGGHNGLKSVINYLNTNEFIKLRCGIGNDFPPGELVEFVLSDFNKDELNLKIDMINKAIKAIETTIEIGQARAFSLINSGTI